MTNAKNYLSTKTKENKKMPKVVTNKDTLKALETRVQRTGEVSEKIIAEVKEIMKTPNKWFVLESTTSSTHVRRVITKNLGETVKSKKTPDGVCEVRKLGTKTQDGKVVKKGKVFVRCSA